MASTNLLVNGSFEASQVGANRWAGFASIPGWTAIPGGTIELWNSLNEIQATDGVNHGALDYLQAHDGLFQTVETVAGQSYTLSFDARSRPGSTAATCTIEVLWNDALVATIPPGSAWATYTATVAGTGGSDKLTIREVASQSGDGLGALYDNFTLVAADSVGAPVVSTAIADQTATANESFSYLVPATAFTDPDGDALVYSARLLGGAALPSWLAFEPASRTFSGTPAAADVGPLSIEVVASDGALSAADTFVLTVEPVASPSSGTNLLVNGSFEASQVGANRWAGFSSIPGWTAISGGTIELWSSLNDIQATDGVNHGELDYLQAHDGLFQTVETVAGQSYTLSFDARSRPGSTAATCTIEVLWNDALIATIPPGSAWATYTATVAGTGGSDKLTIREVASQSGDGLGALYDNFTLIAAGPGSAQPPVAVDDRAATNEDTAATLAPLANDTDPNPGTTLRVAAVAGQQVTANGSVDIGQAVVRLNADGTLTVTPDSNLNGSVSFDYTISNGTLTDTGRVTLDIAPTADAPVVAAAIADRTATVDQVFSFVVPANTFADADGDALAYSARLSGGAPLPLWLTFDAATRTFSGTPAAANVGALSLEVVASDGALSVADTFTLRTEAVAPPPPPPIGTLLSFANVSDRAKAVDLGAGVWANATRILPLGDSNTEGWTGTPLSRWGWYRDDLWQMVTQNGLWIDYVGALKNGPPNLPDRDHQGVSGISATAVVGQATQIATAQRPDAVLLMLGTNDALLEPNASSTVPNDLLSIMRQIDTVQPNVTILLAPLPPIVPQTASATFGVSYLANAEAIRSSINAQLPNLVNQAQSLGIDAVFVPVPSLSTADLVDGVHLTEGGYAKLASAWFSALSANLPPSAGTFGGAGTAISGVVDVNGSELGDLLRGNGLANRLDGRGGADRIEGAGGGDFLTGGLDRDSFVFQRADQGLDVVADFTRGQDLLQVSAAGFGGGLVAGAVAAVVSAADAASVTASGPTFIFDNAGADAGTVYWDPDGASGANASAFVRLQNVTALGSSDFELV